MTDCSLLAGGGIVPSCFALGSIGPQPCAPADKPPTPLNARLGAAGGASAPGDGAMGSLCRLAPSTLLPGSDCQAGFMCAPMAAGALAGSRTYGYCAGGGTADAPPGVPKASKSGLEGVAVAARTTLSGVPCRLPLVVNGSLLTDCSDIEGRTACYTAGLTTSAACGASQNWTTTPLADVLAAGRAAGLDGRPGALCALPLPGNPGTPSPSLTCSPGLACTRVEAGVLKNAPYGACLEVKAAKPAAPLPPKPSTPSALKPSPVSGLGIMPVATRTTADGTPCRLPVIMADGTMYTDCGPLGGVSGGMAACYTNGLSEYGTCAPRNASTPALPLTALLATGRAADGQRGSICAVAGSVPGAVPSPPCRSGLTCRPLSGAFGFCAGQADPPQLPLGVDSGASDAAAAAAASKPPVDASTLGARTVAQRATVAGLPCRLPVRYKGKVLTDCAQIGDSYDHCFVGEGFSAHQKCRASAELPAAPSIAELEADGVLGDGSEGALCVLEPSAAGASPDSFGVGAGRGATCRAGLKCVPGSAAPLRGSRYGYCKTPMAVASFVEAVMHPKQHKEAAAAAAAVALTPAQAAVADLAVASRVTAAGEQCRLPLVVNGTLITDCFAWGGKLMGDRDPAAARAPAGAALVAPAVAADPTAGACFTPASPTVPQRCARAAAGGGGYPLSPLDALLAAGKGADAGPGSLCTLDPALAARVIAPGATSAQLPACGAGSAGCAVLRPGGQLKASGLGFCQALDGADPGAGGAGGPAGAGLRPPIEVPGGSAYLPTAPPAAVDSRSSKGALARCGPACMWSSTLAMILTASLVGYVCFAAFCRAAPGERGGGGNGPAGAISPATGGGGGRGSSAAHSAGQPPVPAAATAAAPVTTGGIALGNRSTGRGYDRFEDAPANPFAGHGNNNPGGGVTLVPVAPTGRPAPPDAFWSDMAARHDGGGRGTN